MGKNSCTASRPPARSSRLKAGIRVAPVPGRGPRWLSVPFSALLSLKIIGEGLRYTGMLSGARGGLGICTGVTLPCSKRQNYFIDGCGPQLVTVCRARSMGRVLFLPGRERCGFSQHLSAGGPFSCPLIRPFPSLAWSPPGSSPHPSILTFLPGPPCPEPGLGKKPASDAGVPPGGGSLFRPLGLQPGV